MDSRFLDYKGTPLIQRIADCVSNGAFVAGSSVRRWRDIDLAKLDARIEAIASRTERLGVRYSFPDWLVELVEQDAGPDATERALARMNDSSSRGRENLKKIS